MSKTKKLMNMIKLETFINSLPENEQQSFFDKFTDGLKEFLDNAE